MGVGGRSRRYALLASLCVPLPAMAQDGPPIINSITIVTHNVFDSAQAQPNLLFRIANAVHVTTKHAVIRTELLFKVGEPYDSARVEETERNLRLRGLFRDVEIDTTMTGNRVDIVVETADGWTTELITNARFTAGEFSWALGAQERNFLGLGARVGLIYRDEPDRTGLTLLAGHDRLGGTRFMVDGIYDARSDGTVGAWRVGLPFRSLSDRTAADFFGDAGDHRVLQFRQFRDSVSVISYRRRAFRQFGRLALAPRAGPFGYLRVGVMGQIKREEYILESDALALLSTPDSVTGAFGAFAQVMDARFKVVTHYTGFAREVDVDLSTRLTVEAWLAPRGLGYEADGIGPRISFHTGFDAGSVFGSLLLRGNGLFTSAGLDSGQVRGAATLVGQFIRKNATVFHIQAGARTGTPPGREFDLGDGIGPRAFGPHAFTGDRMIWGSIEQRAFFVDELGGVIGIGFAAFVDYGGAWFSGQPARVGGDIGFGIRFGSTRSTGPNIGRLDLSYRFGEGFVGRRLVMSFGRGFAF